MENYVLDFPTLTINLFLGRTAISEISELLIRCHDNLTELEIFGLIFRQTKR